MNKGSITVDDVVWMLENNSQPTLANIKWSTSPAQQRTEFNRIWSLLTDNTSRNDLGIALLKWQLHNGVTVTIDGFGSEKYWQQIFVDFDTAQIADVSWVVFPVLVYRNDKAEIIELLLSSHPQGNGKLHCINDCLSPTSLQIANNACSALAEIIPAVADNNYCLIPLQQNYYQVQEGSLGLPVTLALARLAGRTLNPAVYATGCVTIDGRITAVGGLDLKLLCAKHHGGQLLLIPDDGKVLPPQGMQAVTSIAEALLWAELYCAENLDSLHKLALAQQNSSGFVEQMANLSIEHLSWLMNTSAKKILHELFDSPQLRKEFIAATNHMYQKDWRSCQVIFNTIEDEQILQFKETDFIFTCQYFSIATGIANHTGKPACAKKYLGYLQTDLETWYQKYPDECTQFFNRMFVANHHNRYNFVPEIAVEFAKIVQEAEKYHRDGTVDRPLATLYGTLAQNCAFCGLPANALTLLQQQRTCLNDTTNPDIYKDHLRTFSYAVFIHLDCHQPSKAKQALLTYLAVEHLEDIAIDKVVNNPWLLFPLIRYLADTANKHDSITTNLCHNIIDKIANTPIKQHPQQLILYNTGLIFQQHKAIHRAIKCWRKSIQWCANQDDTILPMALLPATALWKIKQLNSKDRETVTKVLKRMSQINFLHFSAIIQNGKIDDTLQSASKTLEQLFPFNYR